MEKLNNSRITVETTINAPVEKVWNLWTAPEHVTNWNHASDDWHSPTEENDLREGGRFIYRMEARDGSSGFDFGGTYTAVKKHKQISYTMDDGRKADVRFSGNGAVTRLTESFEPEGTHSRDMQQSGWQAILDNFKKYAEASGSKT